jgi:hypothetical protein
MSDKKGQALVKELAESKWVVPDELPARANVKKTRKIDTYRDIVRGLWVETSKYRKTIPSTEFSSEKSSHRSDYDRRHNVAPDGFNSKTYTFYVPGSKDVNSCDECKGKGRIDCSRCNTTGKIQCGSCNGHGKTKCRKCSGDGKITVDETCGVCRGSGEKKSGWECDNCGGYGSIETTKSCPNCHRGKVKCSTCSGRGKIQCDSCGGRGHRDCGKCDASGKITSYEYVQRSYSPDKEVSYRTRTVPKSVVEDAEGSLESRNTDNSPSQDGLYRRQDEVRKIPVTSVIYEYLGDKWELFEVEEDLSAPDFPRDFNKQFRIVQVLGAITVPVFFGLWFLPIERIIG